MRRAVINRACQFWQLQKRTVVLTFIPSSIIVSSGWSSCLRATCTSDVSLKVTSSVVEHIYLSSLMCRVSNDRWTRGPRNNILITVGLTDSSKGSKSRRRSARCFNQYSVPFLITIFKKYFYGKRDLSWLPKPYYNAPVFKSGNLQDDTNYRPIAFQPVFENEFENLILEKIQLLSSNVTVQQQYHGFNDKLVDLLRQTWLCCNESCHRFSSFLLILSAPSGE